MKKARQKKQNGSSGRKFFAWSSLIVALLLLPIATFFLWLKLFIFNTNQFVTTLAPITKNSVIVNSIATNLGENFFQNVNAETQIQGLLPGQTKILAPTVTSTIKNLIVTQSTSLITSDAFNTLWVDILRAAHTRFMDIVRGDSAIAVDKSGEVYVDLTSVTTTLQQKLHAQGITVFDNVNVPSKIVLFRSEKLIQLRQLLTSISTLGTVLPILVVLLLIIGILLAVKRVMFGMWTGVGIVISSLVTLLLIIVGENYFVTSMSDGLSTAASQALYQILTATLRNFSVGILISGALITAAALTWTILKAKKIL